MRIPEFFIGCDPEVFLQDATGAYISAIGRIGGTKQDPRPLPIGNGFAVQEDNVALEFNIPPAGSANEFKESMNKVKAYLQHEINSMGLHFAKESATLFPYSQLLDPSALVFGCDPDYNAWTEKRNPRPRATNKQLRSCGGHIHIGKVFNSAADQIKFIKHMDLFAGVPSVLMDNGELRKQLYGKAGAFRPKTYGVEYRTLSNYWIFNDSLIDWAYQAVDMANQHFDKDDIDLNEWGKRIQTTINQNNKDIAASMVDHFGLNVVYA